MLPCMETPVLGVALTAFGQRGHGSRSPQRGAQTVLGRAATQAGRLTPGARRANLYARQGTTGGRAKRRCPPDMA